MSQEFLIAAGGDFSFNPKELVEKARARWPDADVIYPSTDRSYLVEADIYLPAPRSEVRRTEVSIDKEGLGIAISGATPEVVASVAVWVAREAPVPDEPTVFLVEWADDVYPLTPDTTVEELMAAHDLS